MYTHIVSYHRKHRDLGWVLEDFRTVDASLKLHMQSLSKRAAKGEVRNIDIARIGEKSWSTNRATTSSWR